MIKNETRKKVGLDLRREIQLAGFADIQDPDFIRESKNMIVSFFLLIKILKTFKAVCYDRYYGIPLDSQQHIYKMGSIKVKPCG